jgi:hypothetical protein
MNTFSYNGIGTALYSISNLDNEGNVTAIKWFTFFHLPILPLIKAKLKRTITTPKVFEFTIISYEKMLFKEVVLTYFLGWIVCPVFSLLPLILSFKEIAERMGIKTTDDNGDPSTLHISMFIFGIVYYISFLLLMSRWLNRRGLPKDYKAYISKEKLKK